MLFVKNLKKSEIQYKKPQQKQICSHMSDRQEDTIKSRLSGIKMVRVLAQLHK